MLRFDITQGARWPTLKGKIFRPGGVPFEMVDGLALTNANITSIELKIKDKRTGLYVVDSAIPFNVLPQGEAIEFSYDWLAPDTVAEVNNLQAQLKITLSDGRVGYAPTLPKKWIIGTIHPPV